jgi:hypothetical protein
MDYKNPGLEVSMFVLLLVGYFFLLIYVLAICLICHFLITNGAFDRQDTEAEQQNLNKILKSLSRVKFSEGAFGQLSPESECVICMQAYGENDMITTLACNEKHFFHT